MTQVTEREYRAKERERDRYQREKKTYEGKIASLSDEIAELDRAINRMTQVYQDFKSQVNEMDDLFKERRVFTGNQYQQLICAEGNSLMSEAKRCQNHVINNALDELEWLRNEKRNQRNEQYGILGGILNRISSALTWLKTNFFNN